MIFKSKNVKCSHTKTVDLVDIVDNIVIDFFWGGATSIFLRMTKRATFFCSFSFFFFNQETMNKTFNCR